MSIKSATFSAAIVSFGAAAWVEGPKLVDPATNDIIGTLSIREDYENSRVEYES